MSLRTEKEEPSLEECPIMTCGCPFASAVKEKETPLACPAFKDGCPFKEVKTASALSQALKSVPKTHGEEGTLAQITLAQMLGAAHKESAKNVPTNKKCPVFASECPFKTIEPLRSSAEHEWRGWWTILTDEDETLIKSSTSYGPKKNDDTLSTALKIGTEKVHAQAENVRFVKALLQREAPLQAYFALLVRLLRVYEALESAIEAAEKDTKYNFFLQQLRRAPALRQDINYFLKQFPHLYTDISSRATDEYVSRIQILQQNKSYNLLVAHTYTRYLGDLSGGQVLKRAVKRGLLHRNDSSDDGLHFYSFPQIGGPRELKKFKDRYRATLDAQCSQKHLYKSIVQEAVTAFRFNTALLAECDAFLHPPKSSPQVSDLLTKKEGQCPFLQGVDISKLPADMRNFHSSKQSAIAHTSTKCPFAHFGFRDFLLVAALAASFLAISFLFSSS
uniref:heme oxygenase (biliverdin-producing) n=1 Tax=Aureoumbra lagunensis TaxID=44058 RepID=A0A7S3JXE2_9STRA|mmetsp:Transcript_8815/g.13530  ORF Transcript_8815/g.13530 Transcript_8815/m.13530 type:complete len:448 (+) Transcript_8815:40-1383(+)